MLETASQGRPLFGHGTPLWFILLQSKFAGIEVVVQGAQYESVEWTELVQEKLELEIEKEDLDGHTTFELLHKAQRAGQRKDSIIIDTEMGSNVSFSDDRQEALDGVGSFE